jgi:hypothetical protein
LKLCILKSIYFSSSHTCEKKIVRRTQNFSSPGPLKSQDRPWVIHGSIATREFLLHRGWAVQKKVFILFGLWVHWSPLFYMSNCYIYAGIAQCAVDFATTPSSWFGRKTTQIVAVQVATIVWALLESRNNACFHETNLVYKSAPDFWNIWKMYFCVSKNHQIYSMNTYTCSKYFCEVLVEITLYFELQRKTNFWLCIGAYICQKNVFFIAQNKTYFPQNFYHTFRIFIHMCI